MWIQFINPVRALLLRIQNLGYIAGSHRPLWAGDTSSDKVATEAVQHLDIETAKKPVVRYRQELEDMFANRRDFRYGRRSRVWLFTRAKATELDRLTYHRWMDHCRRNPRHDNAELLTATTEELTTRSPEDILK